MKRFFYLFIFCCFIFYFNKSLALQSNWSGIEEAKVRVISPSTKAGDNPVIYLGLEYQLENGWKTYWRDPGEGGFPQTINWSNSINVSSLEVLWPTPMEFEILGIASIGYEDEVVFPLRIRLEDINQSSTFLFDLNFLTCKDICVPAQARLKLTLPSGKGQVTNHLFQIEKYISKVPFTNNIISGLEIIDVSASEDKNLMHINIKAKSKNSFDNPKFYLVTNLGLPVVSPQYFYSANRKNVEASFMFDKALFSNDEFDLKIHLNDKNTAIEYNTIVKQINISSLFTNNQSFYYIFFIALLGGFILNAMPCVLPVLSIKLLSILKNRQASLLAIRKSFFVTSLGIISSFLLLAFVMISIKFGGTSIGWGMQFQQPLFLMIIAMILFLFSLNLFGLFEFKVPHFVNDSFSISSSNKSLYNDYFNGFFATVLATPCSAPFVGTAVTVAFTQSSLTMVIIFFFMGLGMSLPYLLAGFFPKIVGLLPKPGAWINTIKYLLSLLLLGTLVWIGWILNNHFNYIFLIFSLVLGLVVVISFKLLHKLRTFIIAISIIVFFSLNLFSIFSDDKPIDEKDWLNLTNVNIDDLITGNNIVFVDITADWCATCQFNKINVINSKIIQEAFKENNIIKIKGNWTKPNKQIQEYLNSYYQFGVPFNIMYSQSYPKGIILPELLKASEILKTIAKLKKETK